MEDSSKIYVITGATSGIGYAAAEKLAASGAALICVGRSPERCQSACERIKKQTGNTSIEYIVADLSIQAEVHTLAARIKEVMDVQARSWLDGLVNNAGLFSYWLTLTPDGIEKTWAVNHLAPFLLTHLLLPYLKAAPRARVVTVSSDSHYGAHIHWKDPQLLHSYFGLTAYQTTKLANVLFSLELGKRLASTNVTPFALDPGLVNTDIADKGTPAIVKWIWKIRRGSGTSPELPARSIKYLLNDPSIDHSPSVYWKDCQPKKPSKAALDEQAAARLWLLSEKLCGLKDEGNHAG